MKPFFILCFWVLTTNTIFSQTISDTIDDPPLPNFEDSIVSNFQYAFRDIKIKLSKVLPSNQRAILNQVKVKLDTSYFGLQLNSLSDNRTITYNWGVFKTIGRDQVAYQISRDEAFTDDFMVEVFQTPYNRPHFYHFYSKYLSKIIDSIDVVEQAELNDEQRYSIKVMEASEDFRWIFSKRIIYTFLHEFYHQIQNYSSLARNIEKKNIPQKEKDSLLFNLELECDRFAFPVLAKLKIIPVNYIEILHLMSTFKENKILTDVQLKKRKVEYTKLLSINCKNKLEPLGYDCDAIKREVILNQRDIEIEWRNYNDEIAAYKAQKYYVTNPEQTDKWLKIANVYLKGNTIVQKNLDSALYFYQLISEIGYSSVLKLDSLQKRHRQVTYEVACLLAGKIYELKKSNPLCLEYYKKAQDIAIYMPEEYYANLISRVSNLFR